MQSSKYLGPPQELIQPYWSKDVLFYNQKMPQRVPKLFKFGLVSLFNGRSNFVGYQMPKSPL